MVALQMEGSKAKIKKVLFNMQLSLLLAIIKLIQTSKAKIIWLKLKQYYQILKMLLQL